MWSTSVTSESTWNLMRRWRELKAEKALKFCLIIVSNSYTIVQLLHKKLNEK